MFFKNYKGITPAIAMALLLLVTIISVTGFQSWFNTFSSSVVSGVETEVSNTGINTKIEGMVNGKLYIQSVKENTTIQTISIGGERCLSPNSITSGINKISVESCLAGKTGVQDIVIVTDTGIFEKSILIDKEIELITKSEILDLIGDKLTFASNHTDLIITDITIGANTIFLKPIQYDYEIILNNTNNYNEYNCNTLVSPTNSIYTINDLGFDFQIYNLFFPSGSNFYVDFKGRVSTNSNITQRYSENYYNNYVNVATMWMDIFDLNTPGASLYVCPNQGISPNKYSVIKLDSYTDFFISNMDSELIFFENGDIKINYGDLENSDGLIQIRGISDGEGKKEIEFIENESDIANTSITYKSIPTNNDIYLNYGSYEIDLTSFGIIDLTNTNHEFIVKTNKGDFNKTLDVGTLYDSCSLDGVALNHSQSYKFYNSNIATYPNMCTFQLRTCSNGEFTGDNLYINSDCDLSGYPQAMSFISKWNTSETGISNDNQVKLPLRDNGNFNFQINWGDGNKDVIISENQNELTHTYSNPGIYQINITGLIEGFGFELEKTNYLDDDEDDTFKLVEISQWGNLKLGNLGKYFFGAKNLNVTATDALDLSSTTNLDYTFTNVDKLNQDISNWDVSSVTSMVGMFEETNKFNQPLNNWNTSSVTDMSYLFKNSDLFNQNISNWDTSLVTNMKNMFNGANDFNQPINNWNISTVTDISYMFYSANDFDQPLNNWDTSSVTTISGIFWITNFNQPINDWNTSSVKYMGRAFSSTYAFNQPLNNWDTSSVISMRELFGGAQEFNQPLNNWNTSSVEDFVSTFMSAYKFNQPLNNWNTSSANDMQWMFRNTNVYSQDLTMWDVSNVTSCSGFNSGSAILSNPNLPIFTNCTN